MAEPKFTVNGTGLTDAQAMAVRVAITSFSNELSENGLGEDDAGKAIAAGYSARIAEVSKLMFAHQPAPLWRAACAKTLAVVTIAEIAERISELLKGRYFTVVSYFPDFPHRQPTVRTSQLLEPGKNGPRAVRVSDDWQHVSIDARDITWGFTASTHSSEYPKFAFEYGRFTVDEIVPCGDKQRHIFAVEDHSE